jgi:hypothetical protein
LYETRAATIHSHSAALESGWRAPVEVRLRQALKLLLRGFGLKAVSIKPQTPNQKEK